MPLQFLRYPGPDPNFLARNMFHCHASGIWYSHCHAAL
jgi:hypothetical protein